MEFPPRDFSNSKFNEQVVREQVLAPMLNDLGYATGTVNDILLEVPLPYPRISMGRRKPDKDPELTGRADYICVVEESLYWVLEAKRPQEDIGSVEIEQAYSYANHPAVRAIYFCLSNGREFKIYQTNQGPNVPPLFTTTYDQLKTDFETIRNILSPQSLKRVGRAHKVDVGKPVGVGLRSLCKITNGFFVYEKVQPSVPGFIGLTYSIDGGSIYRNLEGKVEILIIGRSPYSSLQVVSESLGFNRWQFVCDDEMLSTDPANPSVIYDEPEYTFPSGTRLPNPFTGMVDILTTDLTLKIPTTVKASLKDRELSGRFDSHYQFSGQQLSISGPFTVHLD